MQVLCASLNRMSGIVYEALNFNLLFNNRQQDVVCCTSEYNRHENDTVTLANTRTRIGRIVVQRDTHWATSSPVIGRMNKTEMVKC